MCAVAKPLYLVLCYPSLVRLRSSVYYYYMTAIVIPVVGWCNLLQCNSNTFHAICSHHHHHYREISCDRLIFRCIFIDQCVFFFSTIKSCIFMGIIWIWRLQAIARTYVLARAFACLCSTVICHFMYLFSAQHLFY